jgi:glutamate transport system substrate-binding protein
MKTTRLRLTAALAALALAAVGCGDDEGETDVATDKPSFAAGTTMKRIQDAGVLKVGTKFDQPLYGEKTLGADEPVGFDVEIAKIVAKALGVKAEFQEAVSKNREPFIQNGTVDIVVATYTINDKRKMVVDFAGPYYKTGQSIMVAKDSTITGKDALGGKKVCSVEGSTPAERIKEQVPTVALTLFDNYSKCAEALKNGQVEAVTTDEAILLGLVSKNGDAFKVVGEQFSEEPYGIGLKKDDDAFRDFINDTLEKAYEDGSWKAALQATVGKVQETLPEPPAVDRY